MANSILTGRHHIQQIKNMQNSSEITLLSEKDKKVIIHTNLSYKKNQAVSLINRVPLQWEVGERHEEDYITGQEDSVEIGTLENSNTWTYGTGWERDSQNRTKTKIEEYGTLSHSDTISMSFLYRIMVQVDGETVVNGYYTSAGYTIPFKIVSEFAYGMYMRIIVYFTNTIIFNDLYDNRVVLLQ